MIKFLNKILQRNKLILPDPQVTDKDLDGINKLTKTGSMINYSNINESNATKVLIGEYSQRDVNQLSSIRTPKVEDRILTEARIAQSLKLQNTPLLEGSDSTSELENLINLKKTELLKKQQPFKTPAVK